MEFWDYKIMYQLHSLDRETKKQFQKLQLRYIPDKTVATHGWIVGYLYDHKDEEVYQKDLERKFQMAPSTMTTILQSMERVGYLQRVAVRHDARLKRVALTEEGLRFHQNAVENFRILEECMIRDISKEDLETFQRVVDHMIENVKSES